MSVSEVWLYFYKSTNKFKRNRTHHEAWCKSCTNLTAQLILHKEINDINEGRLSQARTEEEIIESLKVSDTALCGKVDNLWKHLASTDCAITDDVVKQQARSEIADRKTTRAQSILAKASKENYSPSPIPTPGPSSTIENSTLIERPPKRIRSDDMVGPSFGSGVPPVLFYEAPPKLQWGAHKVAEWNADLCKLMIACNMAWHAVEQPYLRAWMSKWVPGAPIPGRAQMSGRILDCEAEKVIDGMRSKVEGLHGTGQCDGWKNIAKTSLIATMVNVEYKPYFLGLVDITTLAKTAETLLEIVLAEIKYCQDVLKLDIVAWCTDASGESLKMRKLLRQKFSWIVTLDCWAHQINLVVGDYFKVSSLLTFAMNQALEVVKWFINHSRALGILKEEQRDRAALTILSLVLPVLTRWTSHYLSIRRLLQLEVYIRSLVLHKREILVQCAGRRSDMKRKARDMMSIIEHPEFWARLRTLKSHLEPLAFAANVTQSDFARVDVVLITLANLFRVFSSCVDIEANVREKVLASLERRWKKADQGIFILGIVFNPYLRGSCFHPNSPFRTMAALWPIVVRCCKRFWNLVPDMTFRNTFSLYLARGGIWSDQSMSLDLFKRDADRRKVPVNLVDIWREFDIQRENGGNGIVRLAMRILSITTNSASTERVLSKLGAAHTRHRNRLHHDKSRKAVLVKSAIEEKYGMANLSSSRKRKFVIDNASSEVNSDATTVAPPQPESSASAAPAPQNQEASTVTSASVQADSEEDDEDEVIPEFSDLIDELMDAAVLDDGDDGTEAEQEDRIDHNQGGAAALKLANLFEYPSASQNVTASTAAMMEYWQRAEHGLEAEIAHQDRENGN